MGIAQIALYPPIPLCQTGKRGKKVPQTTLASPYTPRQREKKVPQTILASLYTPPPPLRGMPICPYAHYAHMETTLLKKGLPYAT